VGAELQFLHLDDVLFALLLVLLLLVLVLPLAVIHGFSHGRLGGGSDKNEVQTHVLGFADRLWRRHDLDGSVWKHGTHFSRADCFVYILPNSGAARGESSWNHPCEPQSRSEIFMTK